MNEMNETIKTILSRRSIRKFQNVAVTQEEINAILQAAFAAPSAKNQRGTEFVVIDERHTLDALADSLMYGKMLYQATLCIAVCANTKRDGEEFVLWEEDASAAMENILLSAQALGLGSVWLGIMNREDRESAVRAILRVPEKIRIVGLAAIGKPAEQKEPHSGINEAQVHKNSW